MTGLRVAFEGIRRALDSAQARFAIGGSWASTAYGEPRQTNDLDIVAAFTAAQLDVFLAALGGEYYYDRQDAQDPLELGRSFNVIDQRSSFKFDFFPAKDEHALVQIERNKPVRVTALSDEPTPLVSAEDIVIAKLRWYRAGGEVSDRQWRDILGVFRTEGDRLDYAYLLAWAVRLGVADLYQRALDQAGDP